MTPGFVAPKHTALLVPVPQDDALGRFAGEAQGVHGRAVGVAVDQAAHAVLCHGPDHGVRVHVHDGFHRTRLVLAALPAGLGGEGAALVRGP